MSAHNHHISSIIISFSTFLENQTIATTTAEDAVLLLVDFLRQKKTLDRWETPEVRAYVAQVHTAGSHTYPPEAVLLVTQFVDRFPPYQANVFLHEFVLALKSDGCSPATIKNYRSDINQFIQFAGEYELTKLLAKPKIEDFLRYEKEKGLKTDSVKRKLVSISQFVLWGQKQGLLTQTELWLTELNQNAETIIAQADAGDSRTKINATDNRATREMSTTTDQRTWSLPTATPLSPKNVSAWQNSQSARGRQDYRARLQAGLSGLTQKVTQETRRHLLPYLNLLMIALFFLGASYLGWKQFGPDAPQPFAYPSALTRPNRTLSFQGRLTDTSQNPIYTSTNLQFKLYDTGPGTGGVELWDSGTCAITPDQDGIFTTGLGDDCGSEIDADVFTENSNVWLEVTVAAETLAPRQQIKTVAYALNSETLQGYPASASAVENTVLVMNNSGQVVLGNTNPVLRATGTSFAIEANTLTLRTNTGSNGNIVLDPDGTGLIALSANASSSGTLTFTGSTDPKIQVLNGENFGISTSVGGDAGLTERFTVLNNGNVGVGTTEPLLKLDVTGTNSGADYQAMVLSNNVGSGVADSAVSLVMTARGLLNRGAIIQAINTTGSTNGHDLAFFTSNPSASPTEKVRITNTGNLGIGVTSPTQKLDVNGSTNLATGNAYYINGTSVLNASTLGSGVTASSLTSVGTLTSGTWNASTIGPTYGGTGLTAYSTGDLIYASGANTLSARAIGSNTQVLTVVGGVPTWAAAGAAGSLAWSNLTAPGANLSLAMSTYTTGFNWATGTGTNNLFSFTTDASANGTGSLVNIQTGASATVSPLRVRAGATEALFVNSSGNVGVGTTGPGAKMDVNGDFVIRNNAMKIDTSGLAATVATSTPWEAYRYTNDENILPNGNFESWTGGTSTLPDGYTNYSGGSTFTRESSEIKEGTYSVKNVSTGALFSGLAYITNTPIKTTGDSSTSTYTISFWYKALSTNTQTSSIGVYDTAAPAYVLLENLTKDSAWHWYSKTFSIRNDSSWYIRWAISTDPSTAGDTLYIDKASVTKGPILWDYADASVSKTGNETRWGNFYNLGGNVGIGTTAPGQELDVNGDILLAGGGTIDTRAAGTLTIGGTTQTGLVLGRTTQYTKVANLTTNGVVYTSGGDGTLNSEALLAITRGGTNSSATPTAGALAYGTGTAYAFNTAGTSGQALLSGGAGAPTFGTLGLVYGGTNADLSAVATGGLIYKGASALAGTGALSGILQGNGSSSPTAITGTANYVPRWSASAPYLTGTSSIYDDGANVGIGTTVPESILDLRGPISTGPVLTLSTPDSQAITTGSILGKINFSAFDNSAGRVRESTAYIRQIATATWSGTQSSSYIGFGIRYLNDTFRDDAMVITESGNVGIGTTAPGADLDLVRTTAAPSLRIYRQQAVSTNGTTIGQLLFSGLNFTSTFADIGAISILSENFSADMTSAMTFSTRKSAVGNTEHMRITSTGNVGIGYTAPTVKLDVNGQVRIGTLSGTGSNQLCYDASNILTPCAASSSLTGSGIANYVARWTSASNLSTGVLFDNGTNVGIGTTTPTLGKLQVEGGYISSNNAEASSGELRIGAVNGMPGLYSNVASKPMSLRSDTGLRLSGSGDNMASAADLVIDTGGNVGIGTTAPGVKLDVSGSASDELRLVAASGGSPKLHFRDTAATYDSYIYQNATNDLQFDVESLAGAMVILDNGNVGIGTTAPAKKLDVQVASGVGPIAHFGGLQAVNTNGKYIAFMGGAAGATPRGYIGYTHTGSGAATLWTTEPADAMGLSSAGTASLLLGIGSDSTPAVTIISGGNVGIGTTAPTSFKLQVAGSVGPNADASYDLGSGSLRWRNLYLSGSISQSGYLDPTHDNLLYNGDFELGTPGWGGGGTAITTDRYAGNQSLEVVSNAQIESQDFIPVDPTRDVLQLEGYFKKTVAGGTLYFGYIAYDSNKAAITTAPCGTYCYFAASAYTIPVDGAWHKFSATTTGEGASYPNFPVGTKFVRVLMLVNYASTGTTRVDHVRLKRINYGPLFVGNNFNGTNMQDQHQATQLYTTAANNFIITPPGSGNVGIGTTTPNGKLAVAGAIQAGATESNTVDVSSWASVNANYGLAGPSGWWGLRTDTSHGINFDMYNSGTQKTALTMQQGGNVGIGTTAPTTLLEVAGSTTNSSIKTGAFEIQGYGINNNWVADNLYYNAGWKYRANGYAAQMYFEAGGISFFSAPNNVGGAGAAATTTSLIRILNNGNVGIGTTAPTVKLDVGPTGGTQTATSGSLGLIRNNAAADTSPYTQARMIVYGGTGVDSTNWAYFGYGSDAQLRQVYSKTSAGNAMLWGTTSAMDGTGTFTQTMALSAAGNLTIGADATVSGGDITISKSGTDSTIIFPAQTNDPGYIKHYESSNTARMYFNVSDDAGTTDYFAFGHTAAVETAKIASGGSAAFTGSVHAGSNSLAYAYNRFGSAGTNNYAVDVADVYIQHDLEVDGTIYGNVSGSITNSEYLIADDNRTISPSEIGANRLKFGFTSYTNNNASPYADYLHFRSYGDSSGGSDNLLVINKTSGLGMRLYQQAFGSATAYSSYKDVVLADNSPTANYLTKYTGTGTTVSVANSLVYDNGTNVGIGTVLPRSKLDITSGTANIAGDTSDVANFTGANQTPTNGNLSVNTNNAQAVDIGGSIALGGLYRAGARDNATFGVIKAGKTNSTDSNYSGYLAFGTRNNGSIIAERMRIDNTGNVGIGTTGPVAKLDVNGDISLAYNSGATNHYMVRSYATAHVAGDVPNNTYLGITDGPGYSAGTFAGMQVVGVRDGGGVYNDYSLNFNTHDGGVSAGTRMVIAAGGNVGIGITNPTNGKLEIQAGSAKSAYFQTSSDSQITLKGTDTWAGMTFSDVAATDNIWYNGANSTFAIGGGGANVAGKKLHVDGGLSVGANYDATATPTNGLAVEGSISIGSTNDNGIQFWNSGNSYAMFMGNTNTYDKGTVTDYHISFTTDGTANRGWTWGPVSSTPVASLNSTTGDFLTNGYVKSKTGYLDRNMLDTTVWTISSGSIGGFTQNGATGENDRIWSTDPLGRPAIIWRSINDVGSDADGGWNYGGIPIDANKAYRATVWVKKDNTSSGTVYFGLDSSNTLNLNGTANGNPYYIAVGSSGLIANRWYLFVGYVHANNDASTSSYGGVYDGVTGQKIYGTTDYKNSASATTQTHRAYNFYDTTTGSIQYFASPRFEEIDGNEPSIESLLGSTYGATEGAETFLGGNVTISDIQQAYDPKYKLTVGGSAFASQLNVASRPTILNNNTYDGSSWTGWTNGVSPGCSTMDSLASPGQQFKGAALRCIQNAGNGAWSTGTTQFVSGHIYRISFRYTATAAWFMANRDDRIQSIPANTTGNAKYYSFTYSAATCSLGSSCYLLIGADATNTLNIDELWVEDLSNGTLTYNVTANPTGNVGIGTVVPGAKLHVSNSAGSTHTSGVYTGPGDLIVQNNATITAANQGAFLTFMSKYNGGGDNPETVAAIKGANDEWANSGGGNLQFYTSAAGAANQMFERMRIDKVGNVGIGTTAPAEKLHVAGHAVVDAYNSFKARYNTTASYQGHLSWDHIQLGNNGPNYLVAGGGGGTGAGGSLAFVVNNTNELSGLYADANKNGTVAMVINSGGNVGIGTTGPGKTLDVSGNIRAGSRFYLGTGHSMRSDGTQWVYLGDESDVDYGGSAGIAMGTLWVNSTGYLQGDTYIGAQTGILKANGNVGIGTTAPTTKLNVKFDISTETVAKIEANKLAAVVGGKMLHITNAGAQAVEYGIYQDGAITQNYFGGNVGIGTTAPANILQVKSAGTGPGTANGGLAIQTTADGSSPSYVYSDLVYMDNTGRTVSKIGSRMNTTVGGGLYFVTNGNYGGSGTERMTIMYNGNVGIGTTAPGYNLDVTGDIRATVDVYAGDTLHTVQGLNTGAGAGTQRVTGGGDIINIDDITLNDAASVLNFSHATGPGTISSAGTSNIILSPGGNVGVGTTAAPTYKLTVNGTFGVTGISTFPTGGSAAAPIINFSGDTNTGWYRAGADSTVISGNGQVAANFDGSSGAGRVGINMTAPGYTLTVNGQPAANGYTAFTNYSDARLKENVTNLAANDTAILQKINQLRPVSYNYNELTGWDLATRQRRISGFIAQELQVIFPEMVGETKINGQTFLDTNLSDLPLYIILGMQEQQTMINTLATAGELTITSTGEIAIAGQTANYAVTQTGNASPITKIAVLADAVIGKLRAGLITTKDLVVTQVATIQNLVVTQAVTARDIVVEQTAQIASLSVNSLTIGGQTIQAYVENLIAAALQNATELAGSTPASQPLISPIANIESLTAQTATVSGTLQAGSVNAGTLATGALTTTELVATQATVSGLTATGTSKLGSLLADNATISGTLTTTELTATSARVTALEAGMAQLEEVRAQVADLTNLKSTNFEATNATISGTLYAQNIHNLDQQVAAALKQPTLLELLLNQTPTNPAPPADVITTVESVGYSATDSASLRRTLADLQLDSTSVVLETDALFVRQYLEVNGLAYVSDQLSVGNRLTIGDGLTLSSGVLAYEPALENLSDTLFQIQPAGRGTLSLMAGIMTLDETGLVVISGNLAVAGDIKTEGTLLTDLLKPTDYGSPLQVQVAGVATESGVVTESRFEIINELQSPVATISAKGKADFAAGVGVAADDLSAPTATQSALLTSDKTAGKASIPANTASVTIAASALTESSLIYVTPLGSTQNQSLYIKEQRADNPLTPSNEAQFVVGFDAPTTQPVSFTWWIVN